MPKFWGKQIFAHGSFPEVGQKQKTERERKKERLNDGNNNGQATHGARKPSGPIFSNLGRGGLESPPGLDMVKPNTSSSSYFPYNYVMQLNKDLNLFVLACI